MKKIMSVVRVSLFVASIGMVGAEPAVPRDLILSAADIQEQQETFLEQEKRREKLADVVVYTGFAIVAGCLAHGVYVKWTTPVPQPVAAGAPGVTPQTGWWSAIKSTGAWMSNMAAAAVFQSVVLQGVEPFYSRVRTFFSADRVIPVKRFWFISEQYNLLQQEIKIRIPQDLVHFVMAIDAFERLYPLHEARLMKNAAEYILAHIGAVAQQAIPYQNFIAMKVYHQLEELLQQMIVDAHDRVYESAQIDQMREIMRQLRIVNAYCVS